MKFGARGIWDSFYLFTVRHRRHAKSDERERVWDVLPPVAFYALIATAAAAWALQASFANAIGAVAVVILLITALRNNWMITFAIAGRRKGQGGR